MIKRDPKLDRNQVKSFAFKVLKRVHALGAKTTTIDDVESELWVAWCIACDKYDPEAGASFKTYLYAGMRRHINRWIHNSFERFHDETVAASLDAAVSGENGEANGTLNDVVADASDRHDEIFQRENCFEYALTRLSDRAKMFLSFLKDTPPELLSSVKDLDAKASYARERGMACLMPCRITSSVIFDLMGASRSERKSIMTEITQIGQIISG